MTSFESPRSSNLAELVCRSALPKDTKAILELTRHIWNGHDYIPFAWQDWLADVEGFLAVAEYSHRIVGMRKLTRLEADEWWLEGLRVHPDFEGRGFATHIHRYLLERWQALGKGVIRLATASKRIAVHRICDKLGFQKVAEFSVYQKPAQSGTEADAFRLIQADELETAFTFAIESSLLPLCFNLIDFGWQWAKPRRSYLERFVASSQAYWWRESAGLVCANEDDEDEGKSLMIRWVACVPSDLYDLLMNFAHFANQNGYQRAAWIAPLHPTILHALQKANYQAMWDFSLYVFKHTRL